ncbi:YetF domain-containing protein [Tsukamurella asaccharolytica]|uniref:YetF domain-containing protein n=1 Tax=Tsukamurella asaccharolytica TaxID=2592067 RepID=UPI0013153FA2|nr:YetF domain-containing protein [Tsukamurella asaccharolytica]
MSNAELLPHLRQAGVTEMGEVAAVVFESRGTLSVIRAGRTIDPAIMADVVGAEVLRDPTVA